MKKLGTVLASGAAGADFEAHPLLHLQVRQDAEQVLGRGVAVGAKHAHQAGGRNRGGLFQLLESYGGVDVVAQDRAARLFVAGEHEFNGFAQERLSELRLSLGALADRLAKVFGECHGCC